jgi:hypothetical protein
MEVTDCDEHSVAVALSWNGEETEAPPAGLVISVLVVLVDGTELVVGVSFADPQPTTEKAVATKRHFHNFIEIRPQAYVRKAFRYAMTRAGRMNGRAAEQLSQEA